MKKLFKLFDFFVLITTVFCLLVIGIFMVPQLFHIRPFVVRSGSMEPEIPTGSVVFVNKNDVDIEVGDIITFGLSTGEDGGVYVTHRVHKIDNGGFIQTKGDANDNPDGFLSADAVVGTVIFHIPLAGFVLNRLQQNNGYLAVIFLICGLNLVSILLGFLQERVTLSAQHKETYGHDKN